MNCGAKVLLQESDNLESARLRRSGGRPISIDDQRHFQILFESYLSFRLGFSRFIFGDELFDGFEDDGELFVVFLFH